MHSSDWFALITALICAVSTERFQQRTVGSFSLGTERRSLKAPEKVSHRSKGTCVGGLAALTGLSAYAPQEHTRMFRAAPVPGLFPFIFP